MTAKIFGSNEYEKRNFSYTIENIVSAMEVLDRIVIQYIDKNGTPQTTQYMKDAVKIVIEN